MKNEDLQKVVFSNYENGDHSTKIFHDVNGVSGLRRNKDWCKMIRETDSIKLSSPPSRSRTFRAEGTVKKIKNEVKQTKGVTIRKLSSKLEISRTSVQRILKDDLHLSPN